MVNAVDGVNALMFCWLIGAVLVLSYWATFERKKRAR
jgi:hypothetical protein